MEIPSLKLFQLQIQLKWGGRLEKKSCDTKTLQEDLTEGHKIFNSTNNLNEFQTRPDDKASEHELKLQINILGTDVGKNFFPTPKIWNMQRNPPKSLATLEITIRANSEGNETLRGVSRIQKWAKWLVCCPGGILRIQSSCFPPFNCEHQQFTSNHFLLGLHSRFYYSFPDRSIDVTLVPTRLFSTLMTSYLSRQAPG